MPFTFAVDTKNQLTSSPGSLHSYDNNGNLTNNLVGLAYAYDDENRLTFITSGTSWRTGFVYDGLGRMRKQIAYAWISSAWVAQSTNEYVHDGKRVIQERSGSNVPTVAYTRGNPGHEQCRTIVFVS